MPCETKYHPPAPRAIEPQFAPAPKPRTDENVRDKFEPAAKRAQRIDEELPADAGDGGELARARRRAESAQPRELLFRAARTADDAKENLLERELFARRATDSRRRLLPRQGRSGLRFHAGAEFFERALGDEPGRDE